MCIRDSRYRRPEPTKPRPGGPGGPGGGAAPGRYAQDRPASRGAYAQRVAEAKRRAAAAAERARTEYDDAMVRGTSALRCALKRRGFEAGERTTRMVMAPATRDECIGDWCSSDEEEEELEGFVASAEEVVAPVM